MRGGARVSPIERMAGGRGAFAAVCLLVLGCVLVLGRPQGAVAVADACPNATVRAEQGSAYLPDCRGYEQVSPVDKHGSDIKFGKYFTQAAPTEAAVAFASPGAFAEAGSLQARSTYVATRAGSSWGIKSVDPVQTTGEASVPGYRVQAFSVDLARSFQTAGDPQPVPGAEPGGNNLYLRATQSGHYDLVTPSNAPYRNETGHFAGASYDGSTVLFEHSAKFTADATVDEPAGATDEANLYRWSREDGLSLVNLFPDPDGPGPEEAVPAPSGAVAGGLCQTLGVSQGDGASGSTITQAQNVLSKDGSRAVWTNIAPPNLGERQVYVTDSSGRTIEVSASQKDPADSPQDACFRYATPDGRFIFFTSVGQLTDDATASPLGYTGIVGFDGQPDLYRFDVESGDLIDLTPSGDPTDLARVVGVLGASDDGQKVYFAAGGHLTADSFDVPDTDPTSQTSELRMKLYVWDEGDVRYIATLNSVGESQVVPGVLRPESVFGFNELRFFPASKSSRVTPDGRYLLFRASLASDGELVPPYAQLYRFDLDAPPSSALACVSCLPSGAPSSAVAFINGEEAGGGASGSIRKPYLSRPLLNDGRVVFSTAHALNPRDTNEAVDVYLWDPAAGARLLTNGRSPFDSYFGDASADGRDIYFVTRGRLVGTDRDLNLDLYDARVEGGFAEPPPALPPCVGEACQGPAAVAPREAAFGSAGVEGRGNVSKPRKPTCGKKKRAVRRQGKWRCVRKKTKAGGRAEQAAGKRSTGRQG